MNRTCIGETGARFAVYCLHMVRTYAIVVRQDEQSHQLAEQLKRRLPSKKYRLNEKHPEIVFVIGGDGTFLRAVHHYGKEPDKVLFYGLHTGTLGFYSDYAGDRFDSWLQRFLDGCGEARTFPVLFIRAGEKRLFGINEVRVENSLRTQALDIALNGRFFETFRGTGILVAGQLGSTAYNRSVGGAVVEEGLHVLQMTEIAGIHHAKYRSLGASLILKPSTVIDLHAQDLSGAVIGADIEVLHLEKETDIQIGYSESGVRVWHTEDVSYFDRLQCLF